jgi:hypothetical protein
MNSCLFVLEDVVCVEESERGQCMTSFLKFELCLLFDVVVWYGSVYCLL